MEIKYRLSYRFQNYRTVELRRTLKVAKFKTCHSGERWQFLSSSSFLFDSSYCALLTTLDLVICCVTISSNGGIF